MQVHCLMKLYFLRRFHHIAIETHLKKHMLMETLTISPANRVSYAFYIDFSFVVSIIVISLVISGSVNVTSLPD